MELETTEAIEAAEASINNFIEPVVRSTWQANMASPGEENFLQETPPSMHFGFANVSDTPLSASEETPASVVIPEGAKTKAGGRG